jgi:polysaccharide biosynthesis transport protein
MISMDIKDYSEEIDFEKYWSVLKRRWLPGVLACGSMIGLSIYMTSRQTPIYQSEGALLFKASPNPSLTGIKNELGQFETVNNKSDPLSTQAEVVKSLPVAEATVKALNLKDEDGKPMSAQRLLSGLDVRPLSGTDLLQVTYVAEDSKMAAKVVNQVMLEYINNNVISNRATAVAARKFIANQLPETEKIVNRAEVALRNFKEVNGVVSLKEEASASVQAMSNLDTQIVQVQAKLEQVDTQVAALRNQVGMGVDAALAMNTLNQAAGVQTALTELQKVQTDLAAQRSLYRGGHPAIAQLERKESSLKGLLQSRVAQSIGSNVAVTPGQLQIGTLRQSQIGQLAQAQVERLSLARQVEALSTAQAAYIDRSSSMPALEKTQRELERQLDAAQTTYNTLLTKLQEVQVVENQDVGNARIISTAVASGTPISPKLQMNLIMGTGAGMVLGLITAFLLDALDRSVKNLKEARSLFGYTLLGIIPHVSSRHKFLAFGSADETVPRVLSQETPHYGAQEAYQMLQANLKFLSSDHEIKTIVITSSARKEGKSTVAANLAVAISQVRKRVLLIDADMRHPMQHHIWNLTNAAGLSNLIVNQVELGQVTNAVSATLDVMTCGVIPPNPLSLFDSKRMVKLIEEFNQIYDFVIIDAPPVIGTADASVLSKMTNGTLLVVQPGVVNAAIGKAAKQFLAQSGQTVLGMVANNINAKQEPDSYFYYTRDDQSKIKPTVSQPTVSV